MSGAHRIVHDPGCWQPLKIAGPRPEVKGRGSAKPRFRPTTTAGGVRHAEPTPLGTRHSPG